MIGNRGAGYAVRDRFCDELFKMAAETLTCFRMWFSVAPIEYKRSAPAAQIEPAFFGEHAVAFCHRVVMHAEINGQLANRRELFARLKCARDEQRPDAANNLFVDGPRGSQINP